MNVVICDDDKTYLEQMKECVERWCNQNKHNESVMIHSFQSSEDLYEAYENGFSIDMLFLDIQIPSELSGMEVAKLIFRKNEYVPMAFITNYSEYACEGYQVTALRYILKPIQQKDVDECLDIAWNRWLMSQSESVMIQMKKQALRLPVRDILYIESIRHYVRIEVAGMDYIEVRARLSDYLALLPSGMFAQCHKGFLVNIMYVRRIMPNQVVLAGGRIIPLGRTFSASFLDAFSHFYQGRGEP